MRLDEFSRQIGDEIGFRIVRTADHGDWQFIELLPIFRGELAVVGCLLLQTGIVRRQPDPGSAARSLAAEPDITFRNDAGQVMYCPGAVSGEGLFAGRVHPVSPGCARIAYACIFRSH